MNSSARSEERPQAREYLAVRFEAFTYAWEPHLEDYMKLGWEPIRPLAQRGEHVSWLVGWRCKCRVVKPLRVEPR